MTTLQIIGLVALGVVVLVVVLAVVPKLVLHLMKGPLEARIAALYGPDEILMKDLTANNFGLESWGVWQGRGNGGLVLTKDCLHFFRFVSGGDVRVPLGAITETTFTKSHLGKATIYDLLKVRFTEDGQTDSIAWYLTDPKGWKNRIEELMSGRPESEKR
jgi:hypothetical protein